MKILSFEELRKISKKDIQDSKNKLIAFLENHHFVSFAGIYGGVALDTFDKFSDIDVFVIYSNLNFLEDLKLAYYREEFGKADIEWKLVPESLIARGLAMEKNYLETVQNHHKYITGTQETFLNMDAIQDNLEIFLLGKITKISDYYVKNRVDIDIISKMLRGIGHIPSKMVDYTGCSRSELKMLYGKLMEGPDISLLESWEKIYDLPDRYKRKTQFVKSQEDYNFLILEIHNEVLNYLDWLIENYNILNERALRL